MSGETSIKTVRCERITTTHHDTKWHCSLKDNTKSHTPIFEIVDNIVVDRGIATISDAANPVVVSNYINGECRLRQQHDGKVTLYCRDRTVRRLIKD